MDTILLNQAKTAGLVPADARLAESTSRPWPVVLLSALGAWLAAIPLLGVVGFGLVMVWGDGMLRGGPALYIVGALALAAAVTLLRAKDLPLFVEQLALPALVVGQLCIGWALFRDAPGTAAALLLGGLNLALAWWIPAHWLRSLLGMGVTIALLAALNIYLLDDMGRWERYPHWMLGSIYGVLAVWTGLLALQARGAGGRMAAYLESLLCGGGLVLLMGWTLLSGPSMLGMGLGFLSELQRDFGPQPLLGFSWERVVSVLTAGGALAVLAQRWPHMRAQALPWGVGVALAVLALAAYAPALGGILLATALLATSARWTLASTGVAAAVWVIGSFYYQLAWPLADKALLLVATGAVLAASAQIATRAYRRPAVAAATVIAPSEITSKSTVALILSALAATLLIANIGIWQKEQTIRHGQPVFVKLAPVDPRSLMQGDYMRLDFGMPSIVRWASHQDSQQRPTAWLQPDPSLPGAYTLVADPNGSVGKNLEVQLTFKNGYWLLVTDAWYFKEGEAEKFAKARYGEFRLLPSGMAVLVGVADANLQAIR